MKNSLYTLLILFAFTSCEKDDPQPSGNSSGSNAPVSISIESIVLTGFNETDWQGNYWDSSTNNADPFIEIKKDGPVVYISNIAGSADSNTSYALNSPSEGSLPITFSEGQQMILTVYDNDTGTVEDNMGNFVIQDAYEFFYEGDEATEFTDVFVSTSHNDVTFLISGTINY